MSTPEITMDGSENPEREPGRRTDLSAIWRRGGAGAPDAPGGASAYERPGPPDGYTGQPEPSAEPNGYVGSNGHAEPDRAEPEVVYRAGNGPAAPVDAWNPPEPWSPPEWHPPAPPGEVVEPAGAPEWSQSPIAATPPHAWAPPAEIVDAEIADEALVDRPGSITASLAGAATAYPPVDEPEPAYREPITSQPSTGWDPAPTFAAPEPPAAVEVFAGAHPAAVQPATVEPASVQPQGVEPPSMQSRIMESVMEPPVAMEPPVPSEPSFVEPEVTAEPAAAAAPDIAGPVPVEPEHVEPEHVEPEVAPAAVVDAQVIEPEPVEAPAAPPEPVEAPAAPPEPVEAPAVPPEPVIPAGPPGGYRRQEALNTPTMEYPLVTLAAPTAGPEQPAGEAAPGAQMPEPAAQVGDTPAQPAPMESAAAEPAAAEPAAVEPDAGAAEQPVPVDDLPPIEAILPPAQGYREVGFDTVLRAVATEGEFQPYLELGLKPDEYQRIRQILGRRPTESELAMYAIMWSEHCSYKSSKVHLRQFAELAERLREQGGAQSDRLLAGIGANAGVIKVSDQLAVTFKVESHNHPSFVEPHQGAATGIGGIVRDILAMGARPVAVMDPLRFGSVDHEDTKRVLSGVVSGISQYGNSLGLPNIGGEVVFDECYQGNPLVNALCVGVLPIDKLQQKAATGPGNIVVLIGAKTGRDGIGGVSVLASSTFGHGSEERRPSVQVGDPFMEKLLIEACLELYDLNLVTAIQDLGGAGLTCALSEMSAAAGLGMAINLDLVPLREPSMRAEEVLASESQERMMLVVTPENLPVVLSICARWGVLATAIGEVTPAEGPDGGRLRIWWRGEVIVDVPPASLADEGPVYARPMREPFDRELMKVDRPETLPRPRTPDELRATLLRMVGSPNLCDKSWVTEQYDRYVQGNTVLAQPEDSGVIRVDEVTGLGVALSVDGNGRYARLDPYVGAKLALAEAYRNVAVTGAVPVAVTNCLNFGSPEDPDVMWQFAEAVRGLADGCAELGLPVTGGNVSFYNQTGGDAINPTPIVGVLGVLDNVARRVPIGFSGEGDAIFLLGQTRDEFGGSEWAHVVHRHLGGEPPAVDLAAERRLAGLLAEAAALGYLTTAHDLSDGGLAQALAESCLRRNMGAHVALPPDGQSPFVHLFSESAGRVIVAIRKGQEQAFAALADQHGVPRTALGIVTGNALVFDELFSVGLDELRRAHAATLPSIFG